MDIRIDCAICCTDTSIDGIPDGLTLEHATMVLNSYHEQPNATGTTQAATATTALTYKQTTPTNRTK
jgi:hypothetical protein